MHRRKPITTPNPAQEISEESKSLQARVNTLQTSVQMTRNREAVEQIQVNVNGLVQRIDGLRTRGHVFEKDMEGQVQGLVNSWSQLYPNLLAQINAQSSALMNTFRPIEIQMPQLVAMSGNPAAARALLATLQSAVGQEESKVSAAEQAIKGMYNQFTSQMSAFTRHLEKIEYLLAQLAEAPFQLLPTEAGIAAVKTVWSKTGKEQKADPQGVLYLTDQCLIFEQKEEIATKKVLFVAKEKQKVQALQLEAPLAQVDKVETSQQGLLKNEEHIEVHFLSGAAVQLAHFHIWQDNAVYQAPINRARNKDFDQGRAVALDQAAVEKVKAAPAQCPSCGGNITTVVLRGMDSLKCE